MLNKCPRRANVGPDKRSQTFACPLEKKKEVTYFSRFGVEFCLTLLALTFRRLCGHRSVFAFLNVHVHRSVVDGGNFRHVAGCLATRQWKADQEICGDETAPSRNIRKTIMCMRAHTHTRRWISIQHFNINSWSSHFISHASTTTIFFLVHTIGITCFFIFCHVLLHAVHIRTHEDRDRAVAPSTSYNLLNI